MTDLDLPHVYSGKVRDIYDVGDDRLLMVTSDRLSAFDVVMAEPIPDKGRVLTAMSAFWFEQLGDVVAEPPGVDRPRRPAAPAQQVADEADLAGRVMLARKAEMLPVECIVRGYITGSAWKEYRKAGTMHGSPLPAGLLESQQLARAGVHAVDQGRGRRPRREHLVRGSGRRSSARSWPTRPATCRSSSTAAAPSGPPSGASSSPTPSSSSASSTASSCCATRCSRPTRRGSGPPTHWEPGTTPPSFDKQPVRDYLDGLDWDKTPPPPPLPDEVVAATSHALRRGVRAHHRPVVRRLAGRRWRHE